MARADDTQQEVGPMKTAVALVILAAFVMQPASADPSEPVMTAGELQQLCLATDTTSKNVCRVYILGITQGMAIGLEIADGKGSVSRPCVPSTLSGESLADSVKARFDRFLAANPKDKDVDAAKFVATLAANTYPCRKPK
jgi:Rap1a immunity proteins